MSGLEPERVHTFHTIVSFAAFPNQTLCVRLVRVARRGYVVERVCCACSSGLEAEYLYIAFILLLHTHMHPVTDGL